MVRFKEIEGSRNRSPVSTKTLLTELAMAILTGMDTTGQQLGWILMLLASYPKVVAKLLDELEAHGLYGPDAKPVSFDVLGDLTYLTAIIREGMRIAYILNGTAPRLVPEDMTILCYRIPKGTMIMAPGTRAMNSVEQWGDPDVFRPERWLHGEEVSDNYYLAFSTGARDCVGQKLSMLEMRLTIVKLVTRYELGTQEDWQEVLNNAKDGIVLEAEKGIWLQLSPRQDIEGN